MTTLQEEMDTAAANARQELRALIAPGEQPEMTVRDVGLWIERHYLKAGYKRLSKVLIAIAKEAKE